MTALATDQLASRLAPAAALRREELVEELCELGSLDAPSGDAAALEPVAAVLEARLRRLSARVTRHESSAGPLLEAELGPAPLAEPEGVLILCHYDTVWPVGTAATRPPRIEGGRVQGPGVFDMRGGLLAMLTALELLGDHGGLERPVRVLLTPDEETGSRASVGRILECARVAEIVLVPEPPLPGGGMKTSRKGWISFALTIEGRAAHAGLDPEGGVSAVDELVDQLIAIRRLACVAPGVTINCGVISGGTAANTIPARAAAEIDVRFPDRAAEERLRTGFASLAAHRPEAKVVLEELHSRPPLERTEAVVETAAEARALGARLGLELGEGAAGGVSDANLVAAGGTSVLDGIGPEGAGAHALDERVEIRSLVERTCWYGLLIASLEGTPRDLGLS